jgi:hypothetical protein
MKQITQSVAHQATVVQFESYAREQTGRAFLQPRTIELRLAAREAFQRQKFRTNCSDCVPNL